MNSELFGWALLAMCVSFVLTLLLLVNGGHRSKFRWLLIAGLWLFSAGLSALVGDVPVLSYVCGALFAFILGLVITLLTYERLVSAHTRRRVQERAGWILLLASFFSGAGADD